MTTAFAAVAHVYVDPLSSVTIVTGTVDVSSGVETLTLSPSERSVPDALALDLNLSPLDPASGEPVTKPVQEFQYGFVGGPPLFDNVMIWYGDVVLASIPVTFEPD